MPDVKPRPQNSSMKKSRGTMRRLRDSESGNVIAITAAAIVPLLAMIGGGIDISRIYLTKTRLQQACDAGALAGRKSMVGLDWNGTSAEAANQFFRMNFPEGKYGTADSSITYAASASGAVTGNATATVPMTLMALFDFAEREVAATCTADLQLPNTDVMMVLDTTLSMMNRNPGDSLRRIEVLREAVVEFHTALENVRPADSRIRYGFVPYSSTVNVGMLLRREWIADHATYNSRTPGGTVTIADEGQWKSHFGFDHISGTVGDGPSPDGDSEKCAPAEKDTFKIEYTEWSAWQPSETSSPRWRTRLRTRDGTDYWAILSNGVCSRGYNTYNQFVEEEKETQTFDPRGGGSTLRHWIYRPISYPMAPLKAVNAEGSLTGGSFTAQIDNWQKDRVISWGPGNACIEERQTRRINEDDSVPRHDMDIDMIPTNDPATQWKPYLPGLVYGRAAVYNAEGGLDWNPARLRGWMYTGLDPIHTGDDPSFGLRMNLTSRMDFYTPFDVTNRTFNSCPFSARKLASIDQSDLSDYLANLTPTGFTYHDIGFVWGLRLMSPTGLFRAEHQAAASSGPITRHLIFMTDGNTDTRSGGYDAWGISKMDRRRTPTNRLPTDAEQNEITERNLAELCTVAKDQMNITVWVIAFGNEVDLTAMLRDCASPGRAFKADNATELSAAFAEIASQIASLRITR